MSDYKDGLNELYRDLNILKEREAKYAGDAPIELLHQIEDHEQAISLTQQAITGELSEAEWREALKTLVHLGINKTRVIMSTFCSMSHDAASFGFSPKPARCARWPRLHALESTAPGPAKPGSGPAKLRDCPNSPGRRRHCAAGRAV